MIIQLPVTTAVLEKNSDHDCRWLLSQRARPARLFHARGGRTLDAAQGLRRGMRLGVFLCVIVGLGARQASWLMQALFQAPVSKSAIDRWVDEVGASLPSEEEIIKKEKPIMQGHFDELFPLGA